MAFEEKSLTGMDTFLSRHLKFKNMAEFHPRGRAVRLAGEAYNKTLSALPLRFLNQTLQEGLLITSPVLHGGSIRDAYARQVLSYDIPDIKDWDIYFHLDDSATPLPEDLDVFLNRTLAHGLPLNRAIDSRKENPEILAGKDPHGQKQTIVTCRLLFNAQVNIDLIGNTAFHLSPAETATVGDDSISSAAMDSEGTIWVDRNFEHDLQNRIFRCYSADALRLEYSRDVRFPRLNERFGGGFRFIHEPAPGIRTPSNPPPEP
jgi:hypothetical protein